MTEPTYEYVKGQGWIALTYDFVVVNMRNGKIYRFENRKPVKGELYATVYSGNKMFSVNGLGLEPDIHKFKTYFEGLHNYEFTNLYEDQGYSDRLWVTVIPL